MMFYIVLILDSIRMYRFYRFFYSRINEVMGYRVNCIEENNSLTVLLYQYESLLELWVGMSLKKKEKNMSEHTITVYLYAIVPILLIIIVLLASNIELPDKRKNRTIVVISVFYTSPSNQKANDSAK